MGNRDKKKLIVIIALLCISSALTLIKSRDNLKAVPKKSLKETLSHIDGYSMKGQLKVDQELYNFLRLDDYIYNAYKKDDVDITLYIGYYFTADKVSSAHSPLVCFPAQGWILDNITSRSITVNTNAVNYGEMEAALGETNKVLILYWFQTYMHSTPHTYVEKIYALYNRLVHNEGQNAFVRITIPLNNRSRKDAKIAGDDFIRSFYPKFIRYIQKSERQ